MVSKQKTRLLENELLLLLGCNFLIKKDFRAYSNEATLKSFFVIIVVLSGEPEQLAFFVKLC